LTRQRLATPVARLLSLETRIWLLQIETSLAEGALGVVVGLDGGPVLVHGPVAPAGDVEEFADGDVTPGVGAGRLVVAGVRVGSGRNLGYFLRRMSLTNPARPINPLPSRRSDSGSGALGASSTLGP